MPQQHRRFRQHVVLSGSPRGSVGRSGAPWRGCRSFPSCTNVAGDCGWCRETANRIPHQRTRGSACDCQMPAIRRPPERSARSGSRTYPALHQSSSSRRCTADLEAPVPQDRDQKCVEQTHVAGGWGGLAAGRRSTRASTSRKRRARPRDRVARASSRRAAALIARSSAVPISFDAFAQAMRSSKVTSKSRRRVGSPRQPTVLTKSSATCPPMS